MHRTSIIFLLLFLPARLAAQGIEHKLIPQDGARDDRFGSSVGLSADYAVFGCPEDDDAGSNSGSAYLFRWNGVNWVERAKLIASDGAAQDLFGAAVAISGPRVLVGAAGDGPDRGAAYLFERTVSGWDEITKLVANDAGGGDLFGTSVALEGDYAVVGAPGHGTGGAAYVFRFDGGAWGEQAALEAGDGAVSDYFGTSVSISGSSILVGAPWDDDNGLNAGSAYLFVRDGETWTEEAKLLAGDGASDDYFGFSVSLSGEQALIGAYGDDDGGAGSGSAYLFRRDGSGWCETDKLTAGDAAPADFFAYSVALSGQYALIGSSLDDDDGESSGSAYVFQRSGGGWMEQRKLTASDASEGDNFGRSVAISEDFACIGAHQADVTAQNSGSGYIVSDFIVASVGGTTNPPGLFNLEQNYPNPFNTTTTIRFAINQPAETRLTVYDMRGREVALLLHNVLAPGMHHVPWDASLQPSGVYSYRLQSGGISRIGRMLLLK